MDLHLLMLFAVTEAAMALTPGPAVLLAMANGSRHGIRGAAVGGAGIELGNATWLLLSAAGLTALLVASHTAFLVIKWAGAAYLVYLGVRMLIARPAAPVATATAAAPRTKLLLQGFLTQMGNPKAMIFFGALLPPFINPAQPHGIQFLVLGAMTVVIDFTALLFYGALANRGARLAGGPRLMQWFERTAGALLVGIGARIAM